MAENPRSPHGDERLRRIRRTAAAATDKMDVVDAGAADDGAAARRSGHPHESEEDRSRGRRRPHHAFAGGATDRGDAGVSDSEHMHLTNMSSSAKADDPANVAAFVILISRSGILDARLRGYDDGRFVPIER